MDRAGGRKLFDALSCGSLRVTKGDLLLMIYPANGSNAHLEQLRPVARFSETASESYKFKSSKTRMAARKSAMAHAIRATQSAEARISPKHQHGGRHWKRKAHPASLNPLPGVSPPMPTVRAPSSRGPMLPRERLSIMPRGGGARRSGRLGVSGSRALAM